MSQGGLAYVSDSKLSKGDEIFIHYGLHDLDTMVWTYGFQTGDEIPSSAASLLDQVLHEIES